jgi:hypothetical protein
MNMMAITKVSPDEFSKDVDRYIDEAHIRHAVFEIRGRMRSPWWFSRNRTSRAMNRLPTGSACAA